MRVEYHPAVQSELKEIKQYYEERSAGLGIQFIDEFERQVLLLAATPERWMVVRVYIATVAVWAVLCLAHFVLRTQVILAGPKDGDLYAYSRLQATPIGS